MQAMSEVKLWLEARCATCAPTFVSVGAVTPDVALNVPPAADAAEPWHLSQVTAAVLLPQVIVPAPWQLLVEQDPQPSPGVPAACE